MDMDVDDEGYADGPQMRSKLRSELYYIHELMCQHAHTDRYNDAQVELSFACSRNARIKVF